MAPGTGLGTSFALHFGQFKLAPYAVARCARGGIETRRLAHERSVARAICDAPPVTNASRFLLQA